MLSLHRTARLNMTRAEFAEAVFAYCQLTHASGTSAERTPHHNHERNGRATSPHLVGLGRDVVYDEKPPLTVRRQWAIRLGLRLLEEADHDHLQPYDWPAD